MVRTGFSFLKLRIDERHSSILRLHALFSRSLGELSVLINNSERICLFSYSQACPNFLYKHYLFKKCLF